MVGCVVVGGLGMGLWNGVGGYGVLNRGYGKVWG